MRIANAKLYEIVINKAFLFLIRNIIILLIFAYLNISDQNDLGRITDFLFGSIIFFILVNNLFILCYRSDTMLIV